jgi:hypothetical protein
MHIFHMRAAMHLLLEIASVAIGSLAMAARLRSLAMATRLRRLPPDKKNGPSLLSSLRCHP